MLIHYGPLRRPVRMVATRRYIPEQLLALCLRLPAPYHLRHAAEPFVPVRSRECLMLACEVACAYHNDLVRHAVVSIPPGYYSSHGRSLLSAAVTDSEAFEEAALAEPSYFRAQPSS
mmetsp:Transcript_58594/g.154873  ORF Transcript_58594/g.154873 Transcript_58594/m.154873 type:complete len:117 (+) Transcript_58594:3603-3953(+)